MVTRALLVAASAAALTTLGIVPADAAGPVTIAKIQYDSPGSDTHANSSVNGEYVVLKNTGTRARSLTGWTIRDESRHVYRFGSFTLGAGRTVVLRTGKGTNSATTRYWGMGWHVWNNTGDTASVRTSTGSAVDSCRWTSAGRGYTYC